MKTDVILLVGGRSTEHDASVCGYENVLDELTRSAEVALTGVLYVDRDLSFRLFTGPPWPTGEATLREGIPLTLNAALEFLRRAPGHVFSLLHGTEGEDGCWQGLAEILGVGGSFGPVLPSALGMNKLLQAVVARGLEPQIRTPRSWLVRPGDPARVAEILTAMDGAPLVVKPNRMGASLHTRLLTDYDEATLRYRCAQIFPYDDQVLVQEYVQGVEMTCGVLRTPAHATRLPVLRIDAPDAFFGHQAKHRHGGAAVDVVPDGPTAKRLQTISERLFDALDIFLFARFDYLVRGTDVFFLEVNTLPGLMRHSLFPRMLREVGLTVADVVAISAAADRVRRRRIKELRYDIHRDPAPSGVPA
ncbi:D-alanine--D-alanine ligase family protein [Jidongwangia harbinensis]|uniref:D-alanine--D-alanine ligase family protein n=1 Tax=Jidongwangia harbinensis TaxID=2878561 RepID=UPI001CDA3950|nr:hypothetical protein [Jidongwangia harbinensis]MCA2211416.1 hypothetical protein [Jidongwangia harbinensis]